MTFATTALGLASGVLVAVVAMPIELRTGEIPNWLTFGGLVASLVLVVVDRRFALHGFGFFCGAIPGLLLFSRGALGGGGVKLIAAVSTLAGVGMALGIWISIGALLLYERLRRPQPMETASSPWVCVGAAVACGVELWGGAVDGWW